METGDTVLTHEGLTGEVAHTEGPAAMPVYVRIAPGRYRYYSESNLSIVEDAEYMYGVMKITVGGDVLESSRAYTDLDGARFRKTYLAEYGFDSYIVRAPVGDWERVDEETTN